MFLLTGQRPTPAVVQNPFIGIWRANTNRGAYIFDFKADGKIEVVRFDIIDIEYVGFNNTEYTRTGRGSGSYTYERNEANRRVTAIVKLNLTSPKFYHSAFNSQSVTISLADNNRERFTIRLYNYSYREYRDRAIRRLIDEKIYEEVITFTK